MISDLRYAPWLEIAKELASLHEFIYSGSGPFAGFKDAPVRPTCIDAANWIRNKCETGYWYWWDKGWLGGKADEPLRSILHVIGDSGGLYEETESGQEMISRIEGLSARIAKLQLGKN